MNTPPPGSMKSPLAYAHGSEPLAHAHGSERPQRIQVLLWVLLLFVTTFAVVYDLESHPALTVDSAVYIVLARSFFSPEGYGLISRPQGSPPSRFPPGYPLALAPVAALSPANFSLYRLPSLLATLVNAGLLFWGWRLLSRRSYWWGLAVASLYCLSPATILHARLVLSEAVFTTFLLGAVLMAEYGVQRQPRWWWHAGFAALCLMTGFTRTVGWAMLAGLFLYLLYRWRRRFWGRALLSGGVMVLLLAAFLALSPVAPVDLLPEQYARSYAAIALSTPAASPEPSTLPAMPARIATHLVYDLPAVVLPGLHSAAVKTLAAQRGLGWLLALAGAAVLLLMAVGAVHWLRRDGPSAFLAVTLPLLAILLPWAWEGARLLYPIVPQLLLAFLLGASLLWSALTARLVAAPSRPPFAPLRASALAVGTLLAIYLLASLLYPDNRQFTRHLEARAAWLRQHTTPGEVILSSTPELDYLISNRQAIGYQGIDWQGTPAEQAQALRALDVRHALVESSLGRWRTDDESGQVQRVFDLRDHDANALRRLQQLAAAGLAVELDTPPAALFRVFSIQDGS